MPGMSEAASTSAMGQLMNTYGKIVSTWEKQVWSGGWLVQKSLAVLGWPHPAGHPRHTDELHS